MNISYIIGISIVVILILAWLVIGGEHKDLPTK